MKKFVNMLSFIAAFVTSVIIICTFLTSNQFFYVHEVFNSYFLLLVSVSITMLTLSLRFFVSEQGKERILYALFSLFLALGVLYFIAAGRIV